MTRSVSGRRWTSRSVRQDAGLDEALDGEATVREIAQSLLLLHLVLQGLVLQPSGEGLELLLHALSLLLGLLALVELDALLGHVLEALSIELWQRLNAVLVHWLSEVDDLVALLQQPLHEGRRLSLQANMSSWGSTLTLGKPQVLVSTTSLYTTDLLPAGAGHEVDLVLLLLHALHILLQTGQHGVAVGGVEAQQLGQTGPVGVILDDAQLDVGSELLPELFVVFLLCNLFDHVQSLAHQLLADHLNQAEKTNL